MTSAIALYAIIVVDTIYSGAHQLRGVSTWSLCSIWDSFVWRVRTKIVPRGHRWDVPHFGAPSLDGLALKRSQKTENPGSASTAAITALKS